MQYEEWIRKANAVSVRIKDPTAKRIILSNCILRCPKELSYKSEALEVRGVHALVDTGATMSAIDEDLAKKMNLIPTGRAEVSGVHGTKIVYTYTFRFQVGGLEVLMNNASCGQFNKQGFQILLGMDVLRLGEIYLGTVRDGDGTEKTLFSFTVPSLARGIDFVEEINEARARKSKGKS